MKIGDFGQALRFEGSDRQTKTTGTYHFLPPECCSPEVKSYEGKKSDVWGLGVTLFVMAWGRFPFWAEGIHSLFETIVNF